MSALFIDQSENERETGTIGSRPIEKAELIDYLLESLQDSELARTALASLEGGILVDEMSDKCRGYYDQNLGVIQLFLKGQYGDIIVPHTKEEILATFVHELGHCFDLLNGNQNLENAEAEGRADVFLFLVACELPQETREILLNYRNLNQRYEHFLATNPAIVHMTLKEQQNAFTSILENLTAIYLRHKDVWYAESGTAGLNIKLETNTIGEAWGLTKITQHGDGVDIFEAQQMHERALIKNFLEKPDRTSPVARGLFARIEETNYFKRKVSLEDVPNLENATVADGKKVLPIQGDFIPGKASDGTQIMYPIRRIAQGAGRTLNNIVNSINESDVLTEHEQKEFKKLVVHMDALKSDYHDPEKVTMHMQEIVRLAREHWPVIESNKHLRGRVEQIIGKNHSALKSKSVDAVQPTV